MSRVRMLAERATPDAPERELRPTQEQQAALDAFATGGSLVIEAGAGSGKTSTLRMLGRSRHSTGLYLAYNKAIQLDAERRFPPNVVVRRPTRWPTAATASRCAIACPLSGCRAGVLPICWKPNV